MKKLSERSSYSISYIFVKWITLEVTHSKIVIKNVKQERRGESARRSLSGERMRRLGEQRHCVQRPLREARIPVVQPRRRPSARPSPRNHKPLLRGASRQSVVGLRAERADESRG